MPQLKKTAAIPWGFRGTSWPLVLQALSLPIKEKTKTKQTPSHPQNVSPFFKNVKPRTDHFDLTGLIRVGFVSMWTASRQMGLFDDLQVSIQVSVWVFGSCASFFFSSQPLHSQTSGSYSACKCKRLKLKKPPTLISLFCWFSGHCLALLSFLSSCYLAFLCLFFMTFADLQSIFVRAGGEKAVWPGRW